MDQMETKDLSTTPMSKYLCKRCASFEIDFVALWTGQSTRSTYDHYVLGTLESILERSDACGLCRLAVRCFDLRGPKSPLEHPGGKNRTITLYCKGAAGGQAHYDPCDQFDVRDSWPVFSMEMDPSPNRLAPSDEYVSNCRILPCEEDLFETSSFCSHSNLMTFSGRTPAPTDTQFPVIRAWMDECIAHHGSACSRPMLFPEFKRRSPLSSARMIDLKNGRLVDISPASERYFAMSYSWGTGTPFMLTTSNIQEAYTTDLFHANLHRIPRTIRDTMTLLVELGERYLWVDSLCIIQDSEADWSYWALHMSEIYGSSFAVVIARSGTNSDAGLFGSGHPWHTEERVSNDLRLITVPIIDQEKKNGMAPLESRCWTLQEQLFANRMLVFTNGLVSFQCHKSIRRQDVALEAFSHPESNSVVVQTLLRADWGFDYRVSSGVDFGVRTPNMFYNDCLTAFSLRKLTFESDRLPAFLGIANLIASQIGTGLFMGFPIATFDLTMLWRSYDHDATISCSKRHWTRDSVEPPTWCWAAWTGKKTTLNVVADDDTQGTWGVSAYEKEFFHHTWIVWYHEYHKKNDKKIDGVDDHKEKIEVFLRPLKELGSESSREVIETFPQETHSNCSHSEVNHVDIVGSQSHLNPGVPHYTPPTRNTFRRYCGDSVFVASLSDQYPGLLQNPAGQDALHFYTLCGTFEFALCQALCRRPGLREQSTRLFAFRDKYGVPCGVFDMESGQGHGAGHNFPPHLLGNQDVIAISEDRSHRNRLDYWVGETTYLDNLRRKTEIECPPSGRSWPLFMVMVVEWKDGVAYRKAPYIGRICQVAFEASLNKAEWKHVILR